MSCGCGCCPKCGCRATCTCNNNLDWSLESRSDFSYIGSPMKTTLADEHDEEYSFNGDMEYSFNDFSGAEELLEGGHAQKGSSGMSNTGADSAGTYCVGGRP